MIIRFILMDLIKRTNPIYGWNWVPHIFIPTCKQCFSFIDWYKNHMNSLFRTAGFFKPQHKEKPWKQHHDNKCWSNVDSNRHMRCDWACAMINCFMCWVTKRYVRVDSSAINAEFVMCGVQSQHAMKAAMVNQRSHAFPTTT